MSENKPEWSEWRQDVSRWFTTIGKTEVIITKNLADRPPFKYYATRKEGNIFSEFRGDCDTFEEAAGKALAVVRALEAFEDSFDIPAPLSSERKET